MKVEIWVTYILGTFDEATFVKQFDLPFVPQEGMDITDSNDDGEEVTVALRQGDWSSMMLQYLTKDQLLVLDVKYFGNPRELVNELKVNGVAQAYQTLGWKVQKPASFMKTPKKAGLE